MLKIMLILFLMLIATSFAMDLEHSTKPPETFVMTAVDHSSSIEAEEASGKAFLATPLSEASEETKSKGSIVVANPVVNSDEDLITAENIVYRPLFAYRKKMARRQRINEGHAKYPTYPSYPHYPSYPQYPGHGENRRIYYVHRSYPSYYRAPAQEKRRLTRPRVKEAEFPVLI